MSFTVPVATGAAIAVPASYPLNAAPSSSTATAPTALVSGVDTNAFAQQGTFTFTLADNGNGAGITASFTDAHTGLTTNLGTFNAGDTLQFGGTTVQLGNAQGLSPGATASLTIGPNATAYVTTPPGSQPPFVQPTWYVAPIGVPVTALSLPQALPTSFVVPSVPVSFLAGGFIAFLTPFEAVA